MSQYIVHFIGGPLHGQSSPAPVGVNLRLPTAAGLSLPIQLRQGAQTLSVRYKLGLIPEQRAHVVSAHLADDEIGVLAFIQGMDDQVRSILLQLVREAASAQQAVPATS